MVDISPEITDAIKEQGGADLDHCFQCGLCTAVCPWNIGGHLGVRSLLHQAQLGLIDFGNEEIWKCVGCRSCAQACPRGVDIPRMIRSLRRVISEVGAGAIPRSLRTVASNLAGVGNPLGEPDEARTEWLRGLNVAAYSTNTDMLMYVCCYQAYDVRCRRTAVSMINVLRRANVDFGIIDKGLSCCGESIRKAGKEGLFTSLASNNIETLKSAGVKRILVGSPHCYNTLKDEYPELGGGFEVIHIVRYLDELIKAGSVKLGKGPQKKVAYHDSCCLGRYQGIYDEPRNVLHSIPGVDLVEMSDHHADSLCCGGCAGGLWLESKKEERFAELRVRQAMESGAQVLAVSCPYCMTMFEDAVLTLGASDSIQILDVVEIVDNASG